MLRQLLTPVRTLDLSALRRAGRFAAPDEGEKKTDEKTSENTGGEGGKEGEKKGEGEPSKGTDPVGRITVLVDERNTARQEAETHKATAERLQREIDQLKANDQTKVVADLQKQLGDLQTAQKTRFDKLLEVELAALPDAAAAAVKAIPGGSEVQFDWLIANRALFQQGAAKEEEKKGPEGAKHEKKPDSSQKTGVSSETQARIDRQNGRVRKGSGWAIVTG